MLKLSFLSLLLISSFASAEEERRADAHAHGLNNFSMVISQNQVAITDAVVETLHFSDEEYRKNEEESDD